MATRLAEPEPHSLAAAADRLATLLGVCDTGVAQVEAELAELQRMAAADGKRRGARKGAKDPHVYRLGSIFELLGADVRELDDIALLGLLSSGTRGLHWLCAAAARNPQGSFVDLVRAVFTDAAKFTWCRDVGIVRRWRWNKALYEKEVESFARSPKGRDPRASWRAKPATAGQYYLIREVCRMLGLPDPKIASRGGAYEWLRAHGGNPRFWNEPHFPQGRE